MGETCLGQAHLLLDLLVWGLGNALGGRGHLGSSVLVTHVEPGTGNGNREYELGAGKSELWRIERFSRVSGVGFVDDGVVKGDNIASRLLDLGAAVIDLLRILPANGVGRHISDQLLRAATSAGANYNEARRAQSRRDFAHKVSIAAKEAGETAYWLQLIDRAQLAQTSDIDKLLKEANEMVAILMASAKTANE